jgi:hypothetical protein
VAGTPEDVARVPGSVTGGHLAVRSTTPNGYAVFWAILNTCGWSLMWSRRGRQGQARTESYGTTLPGDPASTRPKAT